MSNEIRIDKKTFHKAVVDMQKSPKNQRVQKEYIRQVGNLTKILMRKYRVSSDKYEDHCQDMLEILFRREVHNKTDPKRQAFPLYYGAISRELWKMSGAAKSAVKVRGQANLITQSNELMDYTLGTIGEEDNYTITDDYDSIESIHDIHNLPEIVIY